MTRYEIRSFFSPLNQHHFSYHFTVLRMHLYWIKISLSITCVFILEESEIVVSQRISEGLFFDYVEHLMTLPSKMNIDNSQLLAPYD